MQQLETYLAILETVEIVFFLVIICLLVFLYRAATALNRSLRAAIQRPEAILSNLELHNLPKEQIEALVAIGHRLSQLSLEEVLAAADRQAETEQSE